MISVAKLDVIVRDAGRIVNGAIRSRLLWWLVAINVAFLTLHMGMTGFGVMDTAPRSVDWARIDRDHSLSETFEIILLLGAAGMLVAASAAASRPAMAPMATVLAFLGLDNALLFHEAASADLLPGHQNYGELLFFVLLLIGAVGVSAVSWYCAKGRERSYIAALWFGIGLLGGFGVGLDALHVQAWKWFVEAERWIGIAEDFGESVAISFIAVLCWHVLREALPARAAQRRGTASFRTLSATRPTNPSAGG